MSTEQLWAPWRLEYIVSDKDMPADEPGVAAPLLPGADPGCFLCRAAVEGDDRRRRVVQRSELAVTLLNRYPYNNGHLLVAPRRHVDRLDQLDDETQLDVSQTIVRMVGLLEKTMRPQGFNIGINLGQAAGAGLPGHLHWHIVPRWIGDTNFMPTIAGVHTIPQALEALWDVLMEGLRS